MVEQWITTGMSLGSSGRVGERRWRATYLGRVIEVVSCPFRPIRLTIDGQPAHARHSLWSGRTDVPVLCGRITDDETGPVMVEVVLRSGLERRVEIRVGGRSVAVHPVTD